jgi:NAD(P)H dehydrogenase (quinone)
MSEVKNFEIDSNIKILVTCGNSHLGSEVIRYLLEKKYPPKNILTTVRSLEKGKKWEEKGIQIRVADYKDPQSLEKAFTGVDRIYMVSSIGEKECSRTKSHLNLVEAVKKCEVKLNINSGYLNYQNNNTNKVADDHKYSEKILEESGLNYSIARNATYMNSNGELFKYLMKKEINFFFNTCKEQKIGFRLIRDFIVGACILLMKFPKKIYELFNKHVYYIDIKNVIEKMTGKKINVIDASVDDIDLKLKELGFGVYFSMFIKFMSADYLNGIYNINSSDMEDLIGHPVASLEEQIKEVINEKNYFPM